MKMNSISDRIIISIGYYLYIIGSNFFFLLTYFLSPFFERAKLLANGQKNLLKNIQDNEAKFTQKSIWFHVSSLGEFEQARPVIESLKVKFNNHRIVVTFFSPSGYNQKKNDPLCDAVYYLPFESKKNAKLLINAIRPAMAFWVKYDFWFCYLNELNKQGIPIFLIAAQFRHTQIFFKPYGKFKRELLNLFSLIFCQNQQSIDLLNSIHIHQHILSGDNRFDRVHHISNLQEEVPYIKQFQQNKFTLIAGSSYEIEEDMIANSIIHLNQDIKVIIVPHFVNEARILSIEKRFKNNTIRYSNIHSDTKILDQQVLIIDSIGLLARLYRNVQSAFIGGGFVENGLHNSLEAAAFGMPIAFGPKLKRFPEAQELVQKEIGCIINSANEFSAWLKQVVENTDYTANVAKKSRDFVASNKGATEIVVKKVLEKIS
jgi:3-deoxy-D-manno-octulosonic-acid transferase